MSNTKFLSRPLVDIREEFHTKGTLPNNIIIELVEEVGLLMDRLHVSERKYKELEKSLNQKDKDNKTVSEECKRLTEDIEAKKIEINTVSLRAEEYAFKAGEAAGQIKVFSDQANTVLNENKTLVEKFSEAKVNCARFTTERDELKRKVLEVEKDNEKILVHMQEMKDRVEKLSTHNISLQKENKILMEADAVKQEVKE